MRRLGASKIHIVGSAYFRSKVVVLLLLIHWLVLLSLFVGVVICPCFAMHYLVSFHF